MLQVSRSIAIPDDEYALSAVRAQGAGGQNVNKVATAIHLRFDITASSLPAELKARLLARADQRVTQEGVLVIKAQNRRTQEGNRAEALERLAEFVRAGLVVPKKRRPTQPTRASKERRLSSKSKRADVKRGRGRVHE